MSIAMSIFSLLGSFVVSIAILPQTILTVKNRNTTSLSLVFYLMISIGTLFLTIYGFGLVSVPNPIALNNQELAISIGTGSYYNGNDNSLTNSSYSSAIFINWLTSYVIPGIAIILGELFCCFCALIIVYVKCRNLINARHKHLSEIEYINKKWSWLIKQSNQSSFFNTYFSFNKSMIKYIIIFLVALILISLSFIVPPLVINNEFSYSTNTSYQPIRLWTFVIGLIGSIIILIALFPGLYKIFRTRDTSSLSLLMWVINTIGLLFLFIFYLLAFINSSKAGNISYQFLFVLICEIISIIVSLIIFVYKLINIYKSKNFGISEAEYCQIISKNLNLISSLKYRKNKYVH